MINSYGYTNISLAPMRGIGGAPTRSTTLPTEAEDRKKYPIASGVLDYFPDAITAISHLSWKGNEQHNPGQPLHWARGKSTDEADTMLRHFLQRGTVDSDGIRHTAKMAWRALALLQKEIEAEQKKANEKLREYQRLSQEGMRRFALENTEAVWDGLFAGDRVFVQRASHGAKGAEGLFGTLLPRGSKASNGLPGSGGPVVAAGVSTYCAPEGTISIWDLGLDAKLVKATAESVALGGATYYWPKTKNAPGEGSVGDLSARGNATSCASLPTEPSPSAQTQPLQPKDLAHWFADR